MKAGRELDALVAEKVMGWTPKMISPGDPSLGKRRGWYAPDRHADVTDDDLEYYSIDTDAAWKVVEKLNLGSSIAYLPGPKKHTVKFWLGFETKGYAEADTMPLAVCLAALQVKGVEVPA